MWGLGVISLLAMSPDPPSRGKSNHTAHVGVSMWNMRRNYVLNQDQCFQDPAAWNKRPWHFHDESSLQVEHWAQNSIVDMMWCRDEFWPLGLSKTTGNT